MRRAGVGEIFAAYDAVAEILAHVTLAAMLLTLIGERLQRLPERHSRFDEIGKFRNEEQHLDPLHDGLLLAATDLHVPDRG